MKKIITILFILSFAMPSLAATVGGPEISIPEGSLFLKKEAVNKALDRHEYNMNIKTSLDVEVITKRELASAPADVSSAELEGHNVMLKFSNNFYDVVEPYIKIGSSNLEVTWDQHSNNVKVETDPGFVWALGVKAKMWEFKNCGVKLTLDAQYMNIDLDVDKAKVGGSTTIAAAKDETFGINDLQVSLLASKKYIIPMGINDCYMVPYAGITFSSLDVDVSFTQSASGILYSTYNASDENPFGIVLGCDIMPFFLSYYLLNFELRLINETAFSLGGTIKF